MSLAASTATAVALISIFFCHLFLTSLIMCLKFCQTALTFTSIIGKYSLTNFTKNACIAFLGRISNERNHRWHPTRYQRSAPLSRGTSRAGGVTQSINNYENAKTLPDSKTLSALARALKVTLDDLLRLSGSTVLPAFRFRAHTSFDKIPICYCAAAEDYIALEQAVGMPLMLQKAPLAPSRRQRKRIAEIANQFRHRLGLGDVHT